MKGVLHLLSCGRVLGVFLFLSVCISVDGNERAEMGSATTRADESASQTDLSSVSEATSLMDSTTDPQVPSSQHTSPSAGPVTTKIPTTTRTTPKTTITTTTTTTAASVFTDKTCVPALMVSGGLILVCFIFLMSTLLLAWRVCHLNRRIKALSSNDNMVSNCEYYVGTAKKDKSKTETEAEETTLLMADLQQTEGEKRNGAAKEDGEKVNQDGQKEEEKKAGDAAPSDEASAADETPTENSTSSKPQEQAAGTKSASAAAAASPSEGKEEAKDGP
ncbi:cell wall protein DAN4-like [Salarias fasciatus]|uniref:cell wall protein DAN4-like n=1 Tax=Salarias fasciatus TaxID=181472 RepID=UPI0011766B22|nr:cell wall protein DAN4-like [Salarias fasciatus]